MQNNTQPGQNGTVHMQENFRVRNRCPEDSGQKVKERKEIKDQVIFNVFKVNDRGINGALF